MSSPGSVRGDERLRLFLALRLPRDVLDALAAWQEAELRGPNSRGPDSRGPDSRGPDSRGPDSRGPDSRGSGSRGAGRIVPREHLHVTLAFLGSRPAGEVDAICGLLADCASRAESFELEVDRYRETRSVGMLVLRDDSGRASALAGDVQERLEELGVYRREERPWLPHVTVVRYRERPRLRPAPPRLDRFAPSDAAAYLSRLHPSGARYEVLESFALGG